MREILDITRGLALLAFATGALAIAVGSARIGRRLIVFAVVLVVAEPLIESGFTLLQQREAHHGSALDLALAFLLAIVALAGLVALRRNSGSGKNAPTSPKKRVEPAP